MIDVVRLEKSMSESSCMLPQPETIPCLLEKTRPSTYVIFAIYSIFDIGLIASFRIFVCLEYQENLFFCSGLIEERLSETNADLKGQYFTINVSS